MNRPPLLDEEGDELEVDIDTGDEGYEVLDFDDTSRFDRAEDRELWEILEEVLDLVEDEDAKSEIDKEEEEILRSLGLEEEDSE